MAYSPYSVRSHFFSIPGETGGLFLERSDNERAREAVVVYMQDRGFNGYADNMIKLSVNAIQIEMVCLQAPFGIFDFGPKKLPGSSRNGSLENSLEAIKPMENFKLFSQTIELSSSNIYGTHRGE